MTTKRPPNELESRLHQAALSAPKKELTIKQAESIIPDASARQNALNFLLGVGLFKPLEDAKGTLSFRAVSKTELTATKDLSGEENLVLGYIKASHTEGIWVKPLKYKTNLHTTIIDKCIKKLMKKRLIKCVHSIQYPTRKLYMLEGLEPSIAMTGGPWYTDNEFDTEFIQHLSSACLKFIRDLSFPKRRDQTTDEVLFAISNSPDYPTARHIRNSLRKARLTETELTVEHVETLLNVLILDGEIEKLPAFGSSMWDSKTIEGDESPDESKRSSKKKRKRASSDDEDTSSKRKRKKKVVSDDDDDSSDSAPRKKSKRKRVKDVSDNDSDSESDSTKRLKRKKKISRDDTDEDSASNEEGSSKKKKSKKKKRSKDSSESESSSSDESDHRSRRSKSSKTMKRSSSPLHSLEDYSSGGYVYRAIKQEQLSLGWSESPCTQCPSFEFCKDGGPVNPRECVYYGDWLADVAVTLEVEEKGL